MAITAYSSIVVTFRTVFGNKRIVAGYITFANDTWPSGGVDLTPANLGLDVLEYIQFDSRSIQYVYDYTSAKLDGFLCNTAGVGTAQAGANGATIAASEKVHFLAIGYGG